MNELSGPHPIMPRACVMGYRVGYSRSPLLHAYWLKSLGLAGAYDLVDIAPEAFQDFLRHLEQRGYVGGNVTKPHKETAFASVDDHDDAAAAIGAVNTVWLDSGRLVGSNTDASGFLASLDQEAPGWDRQDGLAVVLGAGGAASAVVYALTTRGRDIAVVNRTPERANDLAARYRLHRAVRGFADLPGVLSSACMLVNATALGTAGQSPLVLDLRSIRSDAVVCDLTYVPLETELLLAARRQGLRVVGGLGMLMHQAAPGFARWFGRRPEVTGELRALLEADIRRRQGDA